MASGSRSDGHAVLEPSKRSTWSARRDRSGDWAGLTVGIGFDEECLGLGEGLRGIEEADESGALQGLVHSGAVRAPRAGPADDLAAARGALLGVVTGLVAWILIGVSAALVIWIA